MIKRTIQEIASMLNAKYTGPGTLTIQGVSTDSRTIRPGNLFVPLIGERFDGHLYVQDAIRKGAAASLWQKDHGHPPEGISLIFVDDTLTAFQQLAATYRSQLPVRVIGVTGSNGKTTTKDLVASILSTTYKVHKTEGNLNNHIGLPLTILNMDEDTEMAVVEMGMSGRGEIALLSRIARPEVAIITNIGEAHLLQLGSREEIAQAKLEICEGMPSDGLLIYDGDEPLLKQYVEKLPSSLKQFRFGHSAQNDFYPIGMMMDGNGTHFTINSEHSPTYYIPVLGQHNVVNALAAIAACKYMGVQECDIKQGLQTVRLSGMRIEVMKGKNGMTILNDAYNASPTSMRAALQLLEDLTGFRKKIVVLGDMLELGEREQQYHQEIGQLLKPEIIDYVFTYGPLAQYITQAASSVFPPHRVYSLSDKKQIAEHILHLTDSHDVVLVKGSRGMKLEEVVAELVRES